MDKYTFTAKLEIYMGVSGYMLSQFFNGELRVKQWIRSKDFDNFCEAAGINKEDVKFVE